MIDPSEHNRSEIAKIRNEVQRRGGFTVTREQMRLICPPHFDSTQQYECISAIARREGWSFAFLRDGSVHFGAYSAALSALIAVRSATARS